jgi:amidophosphoribosyltransferase
MFEYDKLKEECGVFGVYDTNGDMDCARLTYYGLYALQHRGQESCGMAVNDSGTILQHKNMGLVNEVFNDVVLNHLKGKSSIGHVRYSTAGGSKIENAQPLVIKYSKGPLALAHNGNLINADELREKLEAEGAIFQTTIDSEVIAYLVARARMRNHTIEEAILEVMDNIKGGYSLVLLNNRKLIGARDPFGIRPLCIGKLDNAYILSSETCGLDAIGAEFIRDVEPGEVVIIDEAGIKSMRKNITGRKLCAFEYIYFARPDSIMDGISIYNARINMGRELAKLYPVDADIVIGVPDSGLAAAIGYSKESGR